MSPSREPPPFARLTVFEIDLRERMAKLEGLPEGLREAIAGRTPA